MMKRQLGMLHDKDPFFKRKGFLGEKNLFELRCGLLHVFL